MLAYMPALFNRGSLINNIKKISKLTYKIYVAIGIFAMALIVACVIFSVISRYFFGISFIFLEEFITTVFAFTTFWGIGICFMEDEMVVINTLYNKLTPRVKIAVTYFNFLVTSVVTITMIKYGLAYTQKFGDKVSMGMSIPMKYMYGIIPIGCTIGLICLFVKIGCYTASLINDKSRA